MDIRSKSKILIDVRTVFWIKFEQPYEHVVIY